MNARFRLRDALLVWLLIVAAGAGSGALMNAVNGLVSPAYFEFVLFYSRAEWSSSPQQLYGRAVLQGVLEGSVISAVLGLALSIYVAFASRLNAPPSLVVRVLWKGLAVLFAAWAAMGVNAMALYLLAPQLPIVSQLLMFQMADYAASNAPNGRIEAARVLWVGGSIYGAYLGSVLALFAACLWFKRAWKAELKRACL